MLRVNQVRLLLKQTSAIVWSQFATAVQYQADKERSGEAVDEEEVDGWCSQPDIQEIGLLNCEHTIVVQRDLKSQNKNLHHKY